MSVQGIKRLSEQLKARKFATSKGLRKGLYRAGLFLQRESMKIVPIDQNVLRPSAFTRMEEGTNRFNPAVIVGYGTDYAVFVHEDLEARHKPGKQAKFLEQPLREKRARLAEIVEEVIKGEFR